MHLRKHPEFAACISTEAQLAVFTAGYLWGDVALTHAIDLWQDLSEASRIKLEERL